MSEKRGWFKSSRSQKDGACVEVNLDDSDSVLVRDTKNRQDGMLRFTNQEWGAFVDGVRDGEFDRR